jgi:Arc/MetJ family transcription regulator
MKTSVKMTSIRLDTKLADDAAKVLGVSNRSEAVHMALREVVALKKFKQLMSKYGGKLEFEAYGK